MKHYVGETQCFVTLIWNQVALFFCRLSSGKLAYFSVRKYNVDLYPQSVQIFVFLLWTKFTVSQSRNQTKFGQSIWQSIWPKSCDETFVRLNFTDRHRSWDLFTILDVGIGARVRVALPNNDTDKLMVLENEFETYCLPLSIQCH